MAFFVVFLMMLLTSAGLTVDVGNWYWHIQRSQRAADAAALAGAAYLPGDVATADSAARSTLQSNDVDNANIIYTGPYEGRPAFMKVTVKDAVPSVFLQLIGVDEFHYERMAVATYRQPIAMGSPDNTLGREPAELPQWNSRGNQYHFMLGQNSRSVDKSYADRWDTQNCAGGTPSTPPDYCSGGLNSEYEAGGRTFSVVVRPGVTGTLAIEMYDPLYANTDTTCDGNKYAGLAGVWGGPLPINYASYATAPDVCAGDWGDGSQGDVRVAVSTPAKSPGGSQEINVGLSCAPRVYDPLPTSGGSAASWAAALKQPVSSIYDTSPANTFHKWTRVCDIPIGAGYAPGEYLVKVDYVYPMAAALHNYYALRAAILDGSGTLDTAATAQLRVHATDKIVAVINSHDTSTLNFYAAQISASFAGTTIHFQTYDLGDSPMTTMTFDLGDGSAFSSCKMTFPDGQVPSLDSPVGCTFNVTGMSTTFNSRVTDIAIPIPASFSCVEDTDGCWIRLRVNYENSVVTDGSSWSIKSPGSPLALYNPSLLP